MRTEREIQKKRKIIFSQNCISEEERIENEIESLTMAMAKNKISWRRQNVKTAALRRVCDDKRSLYQEIVETSRPAAIFLLTFAVFHFILFVVFASYCIVGHHPHVNTMFAMGFSSSHRNQWKRCANSISKANLINCILRILAGKISNAELFDKNAPNPMRESTPAHRWKVLILFCLYSLQTNRR